MAFRKEFVDPETGAIYPDAYWYPGSFTVSVTTRTASINYVAVVNEASVIAKRPLDRAVKEYPFSDASFATLLQTLGSVPPEGESFLLQLANLLDTLALSIKDVRKEDDSFESFFEDAERIAPDLATLAGL